MKTSILSRTAAVLLTAALLTALFAGCNQRQFERVETTAASETTTEAPTEAPTQAEGTFTFASNIQMGMTIAEVQAAIGQISEVTIQDDRKSLSNEFSGVFINYSTTKSVVFMFDRETDRLEQMQFRGSTQTDGADTAGVILLFNARYGKQAVHQGNYVNHIWYSDGVYILVSEISENEYAVTYTEKAYFESRYADEAAAYERAQ